MAVISSTNEMQPFTAARIKSLSEPERADELKRVGLRFLKANNLMRCDGHDIEFAVEIADRFYRAALTKLERANRYLKAA